MDDSQFHIRDAKLEDIPHISALSGELGYTSNNVQTRKRLESLLKSKENAVYVALDSKSTIIGWVHVFCTHRVESNSFGEIGGLIVSEQHRKQGAGKKLIHAAQNWLKQTGIKKLRVRSNIERENAQLFYSKLGFEIIKTQTVLDKILI